jgi:hypothetical protein
MKINNRYVYNQIAIRSVKEYNVGKNKRGE